MTSTGNGNGGALASSRVPGGDYDLDVGESRIVELRMPANVTVSAKINRVEKEALVALARMLGISQSSLIRMAIRKFVLDYYKECGGDSEGSIARLVEVIERASDDHNASCPE